MKVRALQTVIIGPGTVLALSERQAARRAHLLLAEGGGRWRTLAPVQFKAGEEFGVDVALPKALAAAIETDAPATDDAPPAAARKRTTVTPRPAPGASPATALVDPARLDIE